jgi:hypothetical protein
VSSIYEVQQKGGMKNILLEKKLEAIQQELETKEAQLSKVIAAANLDQGTVRTVTQKVDDIMTEKNGRIKDLEYELARAKKSNNEIIRVYEAKLKEFGIPLDELGFKPQIMEDVRSTTTPANLVVA